MKSTAKSSLPAAVNSKFTHLFELNKITSADIKYLDDNERYKLQKTCIEKLNRLKDTDRDIFLAQVDEVLPAAAKNNIWEYNHTVITSAVSEYMFEYGVMPTKNIIAKNTGLSRQTIAKHFREFITHPEFIAESGQFELMTPRIISNIYRQALKENIKASKLYLDTVGAKNKNTANNTLTSQNNYIQINNTVLSQENLAKLTAEQLTQIENIITTGVLSSKN